MGLRMDELLHRVCRVSCAAYGAVGVSVEETEHSGEGGVAAYSAPGVCGENRNRLGREPDILLYVSSNVGCNEKGQA